MSMSLSTTVALGDPSLPGGENLPVVTVNVTRTMQGPVTIYVYESLTHPGRLVLDLEGEFPRADDDLAVCVNDRYATIFGTHCLCDANLPCPIHDQEV
jgi:hypothetical protein